MMNLNEIYLQERHSYWKFRIGEAGIWSPGKFLQVGFSVRRRSKTCHGLFRRKTVRKWYGRVHTDQIFIYRNSDEMTVKHIDSILVHEMIHQYIIQNGLRDKSAHGPLFRDFMARINYAFPDELKITISIKSTPREGKGDKTYLLILVEMRKEVWFCCRLDPKYADRMMATIKDRGHLWGVRSFTLCESDDMYFESMSCCRSRIHGLKRRRHEMVEFCKTHNVHPLDSKELPQNLRGEP